MEKVKCAMECGCDVLVTDAQRKQFDEFACSRCYEKVKLSIFATATEGQRNFFKADEFRLNGRRCGVSYARAM